VVGQSNFVNQLLFDVSVEVTQIRSFAEALDFLQNHTSSICLHSTDHGDPTILSIEILQLNDKA